MNIELNKTRFNFWGAFFASPINIQQPTAQFGPRLIWSAFSMRRASPKRRRASGRHQFHLGVIRRLLLKLRENRFVLGKTDAGWWFEFHAPVGSYNDFNKFPMLRNAAPSSVAWNKIKLAQKKVNLQICPKRDELKWQLFTSCFVFSSWENWNPSILYRSRGPHPFVKPIFFFF